MQSHQCHLPGQRNLTTQFGQFWTSTEYKFTLPNPAPMELTWQTIAVWLLSMLLAWITGYNALITYFSDKASKWSCQLIGVIHAVAVCYLVYIYQLRYDKWVLSHPGEPVTNEQAWIILFSFSFFIFEIGWYVGNPKEAPTSMVLHHLLTIAVYTVTLYLNESGYQVCGVLFISEISTPLLQLRYFARYYDYPDMVVFIIDIVFGIIFVTFRFIYGSCVMYYAYYETNLRLFIKLSGLALYGVSWCFIALLAQKLQKNYNRIVSSGQSRVKDCQKCHLGRNITLVINE